MSRRDAEGRRSTKVLRRRRSKCKAVSILSCRRATVRPSVRPSVDLSLLAAAAAARTEPRRVRDGPRSSGPRPADGRPGSDDAGEKTRTSRRRSPGRTNTSRVCLSATKYDTIRGALNGSVYRTDTATTHTHTRLTALFRDYPGEPVPER